MTLPPPRSKPRVTARWKLVLIVMAVTWAGMAYLIYTIIKSAKL